MLDLQYLAVFISNGLIFTINNLDSGILSRPFKFRVRLNKPNGRRQPRS